MTEFIKLEELDKVLAFSKITRVEKRWVTVQVEGFNTKTRFPCVFIKALYNHHYKYYIIKCDYFNQDEIYNTVLSKKEGE